MTWELLALLLGLQMPQTVFLAYAAYRLNRVYRLLVVTARPIRGEWRILCKLLVQSGMFNSEQRRKLLLADLPGTLVASLDLRGAADTDMQEITQGAARWSREAFRQLLQNAQDALNGSDPGKELARLRADWQL